MTSPTASSSYRLYSVAKLKTGKAKWTEIGIAFAHKDGNGYSFKLKAVPAPGGEFVMRRKLQSI